MIFSAIQCRMARVALGWGVRELAAAAKVSPDTVARFERGDELKERTVDSLRQALEAAGVEFTNGEQPGVLLTKAAGARFSQLEIPPTSMDVSRLRRRKTATTSKKKR
jgi:transcriptional regulator with XRE-family HTH domain